MSDTVLILGAGFSYDAGIPLMSNFGDIMWDISIRGTCREKQLSLEELGIFKDAMDIQFELDHYHGRVSFNDRNIEDILSILSFDEMVKGNDNRRFNKMINAITKTIEMTSIKLPDNLLFNVYTRFWNNYIKISGKKRYHPTIITFNYDLVLENNFVPGVNSSFKSDGQFIYDHDGINLKYYYNNLKVPKFAIGPKISEDQRETSLKELKIGVDNCNHPSEIEILKLHGSINFSKNKINTNWLELVNDPLILPPIFNKMNTDIHLDMWKVAIERLRNAKNIIFVGYSLPRTDIYMQYFLKSALGPNKNLNKVFIFDPVLFKNDDFSKDMENRFSECFSEQMQSRLEFRPNKNAVSLEQELGTTTHFVNMMDQVFF